MDESKKDLTELREAVEANPDDRDTSLRLAQYYADIGWFTEAAEMYRGLLGKFPADYALLLDYGNLCFKRQNYTDARGVFERLTQLRPERIEGWNNLGIVQLTLEDHDGARGSFEKVLELEPENHGALLNLGNYYERQGNHDRAIELFRKAVEARPDFADGWFNIGNAHLQAKRHERAAKAFEKALRYQPEFPSALKNLGFACEQLGDTGRAETLYRQALELNRTDAALYVNLANLCLQKQRLDESRDFFLKAARLAPRDPAGWMGLRQVSYLKGDIATYVRATLAVMHRLEDEDIADAVGRLRELQHLDQVDTILAQADKLGKSGDELDAERMLAYHRSGNSASSSPSASMLYQRLARLSNPSEHVRYCLAWYSLITDKPDRAARFLEELDGEQEGVRKLQWRVMIAQRRFDEVEQALEQYLEKNPTCFDAWFQLARMEAARGNIRTATLHMKNARTHGLSAADIADENPELKKIFDKQSKA